MSASSQEHDAVIVLDEVDQHVGVLAAEMNMHHAVGGQERIPVCVDPSSIEALGKAVAAVDDRRFERKRYLKLVFRSRATARAFQRKIAELQESALTTRRFRVPRAYPH